MWREGFGSPARSFDGIMSMAGRKAKTGGLTVKVAGAIADGNGGWLDIGDVFMPADETAGAELVAKGFASA